MLDTNDIAFPLQPPPPKIMFTGVKCSGVTSQIAMLCEKYKLEQMELLSEYMKIDKEELTARQRARLLDRGFKGMPEPEDPEAEPEVDAEIVEDPEDFEKGPQELIQFQKIIKADTPLVIDGMWKDEEDGGINPSEPFYTLLENARRMPEVIVVLNCKEESSVERKLADDEEELKAKFDQQMEEREKARVAKREEDRAAKLAELKEAGLEDDQTQEQRDADIEKEMETWETERDEQEKEEDENDEEKPDLEKMKEELGEKIKETHAKQTTFLEEMKEALEPKKIEVIEIDTSKLSAEFVHIKLLDKL